MPQSIFVGLIGVGVFWMSVVLADQAQCKCPPDKEASMGVKFVRSKTKELTALWHVMSNMLSSSWRGGRGDPRPSLSWGG